MKSKKITFKNSQGQLLSGILDFPVIGEAGLFAIFAHCFTCSKNLKAIDTISRALTDQNIAVLRFDFTGLGQSQGAFSDTNFSTNITDLENAYSFLEDNYEAPQLIIGHSLGGAAVLHVSKHLKAIQAVATIGAPAEPEHVRHLFDAGTSELKTKGEAEVNIGGRPFKVKKQFLDDLENAGGTAAISKLEKALLVLHSPQDTIVGIENAAKIYVAAKHPKSFVTLDGADHLLTDSKDSTYAGQIISQWARRYVKFNAKKELAPEGEVKARIVKEDKFLTQIMAGHHQLVADEPEASGGTDIGPSPYDYLLSALGACTAMTLRMYAEYKGINLQEVNVHLTHEKVHSQDGEGAEKAGGKIDQIKRLILLEGDLTAEERSKLIAIADRCPIHKTLEGKPLIITQEQS